MVKIGIDARLYNHTGIGIYLQNLLFYLEKKTQDNFTFHIYLMEKDFPHVQFKNGQFRAHAVSSHWHSISEQTLFAKKLYEDNLDLMHFTYFSYPVLYRKKFISTIHDVTPIYFKTGRASTKNPLFYEIKHLAFKYVLSEQIKNAKAIITPTKTVKKQLEAVYGGQFSEKIHTIYEGVDHKLEKFGVGSLKFEDKSYLSSHLKRLTSNSSFFIYVGNFYPHKNVERLVKGFARLETDAKLILIGPDDFFSSHLSELIDRLDQKNKIIFHHNPSREELVFFYKNALALIHPSLSEGFGLPIVEAAYFKLPIIASNIDVFKELLNNEYISFNPLSVEDIAVKIQSFLRQGKTIDYKEMIKRFSFEEMADKTFELYRRTI